MILTRTIIITKLHPVKNELYYELDGEDYLMIPILVPPVKIITILEYEK